MTAFSRYVQNAIDLGLMEVKDGKIVSCDKNAIDTVLGVARVVEKIQPDFVEEEEGTSDQESIVLCRVLTSAPGVSRELWSKLRTAFGVGHGQHLPASLWSTKTFQTIAQEIDEIYLGQRTLSQISRSSLITEYASGSGPVSITEYNQTVSFLADHETMKSYGDAASEWDVALDILRNERVRALYAETLANANRAVKSKTSAQKAVQYLVDQSMECLSLMSGSIGNQGNSFDIVEDLLEPGKGFMDRLSGKTITEQPVSTGIPCMDMDMEGGIFRNSSSGGRLFTIAARTGVGKTILGCQIAANAAVNGVSTAVFSVELSKEEILARIWSSVSYNQAALKYGRTKTGYIEKDALPVGDLLTPPQDEEGQARVQAALGVAANAIQSSGGNLRVEEFWGADVDKVINSMRHAKAQDPSLRVVVVDHFHAMSRHPKAPANDSSMQEERAYKLMTVAKELNVDLFVLAQMNRVGMDAVSRNQEPQLNEIRGTDALSHVSHAVWIVRKPPKDKQESGEFQKRDVEFWHAKVRGRQALWENGRLKTVQDAEPMTNVSMAYNYSAVAYDGILVKNESKTNAVETVGF